MASLVSVFAAMRLTNVPSNLHTLCACAPERFSAQVRYALPALRSPARRDEGWMRHALCGILFGEPTFLWMTPALYTKCMFASLTPKTFTVLEVFINFLIRKAH